MAALKMDEAQVAENPNDGLYRRGLSISYSNVGDVLSRTKRHAEALKQYRLAVEIDEGLSAADPEDAWAHKYLVYNYLRLGDAQFHTGDPIAAGTTLERCLKIAKRRSDSDLTNVGALADLADTYSKLGEVNLSEGLNANLPPKTRTSRLLTARSWYQQSLHLWEGMRTRGVLRGVQSHAPEQVAAQLSRCEAAIRDMRNPRMAAN
jgi:tetratricopeptide (TPR) repeat protein